MASFEFAYRFMAPHEWNARRNYTNDKRDPGGATKFGITLAAWKSQGSLTADKNHDGVIDAEDIMLLEEGDARAFYMIRYWRYVRTDGHLVFDLGAINDDALAAKVFDTGVNLGPETAIKYLQTACCRLGVIVSVDGGLGPKTLEAVNALDPKELIKQIGILQAAHYREWVAKKPEREAFKAGLLARAAAVPELANGASA